MENCTPRKSLVVRCCGWGDLGRVLGEFWEGGFGGFWGLGGASRDLSLRYGLRLRRSFDMQCRACEGEVGAAQTDPSIACGHAWQNVSPKRLVSYCQFSMYDGPCWVLEQIRGRMVAA